MFSARTEVMLVGLAATPSMICGAAEDIVVMRNTWMTWKAKYAFCVKSSTLDVDTSPESLAQTVQMVSRNYGNVSDRRTYDA